MIRIRISFGKRRSNAYEKSEIRLSNEEAAVAAVGMAGIPETNRLQISVFSYKITDLTPGQGHRHFQTDESSKGSKCCIGRIGVDEHGFHKLEGERDQIKVLETDRGGFAYVLRKVMKLV